MYICISFLLKFWNIILEWSDTKPKQTFIRIFCLFEQQVLKISKNASYYVSCSTRLLENSRSDVCHRGQSWKKRVIRVLQNLTVCQILRHICPVFRKIFTKCFQILSNFTNFYKSLKKPTKFINFTKFLPNFAKLNQIKVQISDLHNFVAILNCCNLRVFSPPNLYPKKVRVEKK